MVRCVLFDLDGVLVEARDWHYHALNKSLMQISGTEISLEEHLSEFNGLPTAKKLEILASSNRIKEEDKDRIWKLKQDLTVDTIKEIGEIDKEKVSLMSFLKDNQFKIGCVTNSIRKTAKLMLEVTGQFEFIDLLISNEDVKVPKPDSEGYMKALDVFSCLPHKALIVEDSEYGIQAASKTGAKIMKVSCAKDVTLDAVKRCLYRYEL